MCIRDRVVVAVVAEGVAVAVVVMALHFVKWVVLHIVKSLRRSLGSTG